MEDEAEDWGDIFGGSAESLPQILGITAQVDDGGADWGDDFDLGDNLGELQLPCMEEPAVESPPPPQNVDRTPPRAEGKLEKYDDGVEWPPAGGGGLSQMLLGKKIQDEDPKTPPPAVRITEGYKTPKPGTFNTPVGVGGTKKKSPLGTTSFSTITPTTTGYQLPSKYRLLEPQVEIIRFDKPSALWSINPFKAPELGKGWDRSIHHFRDSSELEGWLGGLAARHGATFSSADGKIPDIMDLHQKFKRKVGELERQWGTRLGHWVREYMQFCNRVYYLMVSSGQEAQAFRNSSEVQGVLWTELFRFFEMIQQMEEGGGRVEGGGEAPPLPSGAAIENAAIFQMFSLSLSVEAIAAPSSERAPELQRVRQYIFQRFKKEGKVFETSALFQRCQIDRGEAVQAYGGVVFEVLERCSALLPLMEQILRDCVERGEEGRGGRRGRGRGAVTLGPPNGRIVQKIKGLLSEEEVGVLASCLCSIELCWLDLSPLTAEPIKRDVYEDEDESETEENTSFIDMSSSHDVDTDEEGEEFEEMPGEQGAGMSKGKFGGEEVGIMGFVRRMKEKDNMGTVERMAILFHLYPLLSLLNDRKHHVAFILGRFARSSLTNRMAEKLLFEALVLMDMKGNDSIALPFLFSNIGVLCLSEYCEVLLKLEKISYAVVGWRVCGAILRIQRQGGRYIDTLSKIALVAAERLDRRRAILIYRDILEFYVMQKKVNEIVFVSETISKLYKDLGKFQQAEAALLTAVLCLARRKKGGGRIHDLHVKLANLYIQSYHSTRGLSLLRHLLPSCPTTTRPSLLLRLAKNHAVQHHLVECEEMISQLAKIKVPPSMEFLILKVRARNALASQDYGSSLHFLWGSLQKCDQHSLIQLGRLHFLRGVVLHRLFLGVLGGGGGGGGEVFPLRVRSKYSDLGGSGGGVEFSLVYLDKGHLLQDCLGAFGKGYEYFRAASDDVRIAKTVAYIAEVYLDYFFIPVCLNNTPLSSLTTIKKLPPPTFPPPPSTPSSSSPADPETITIILSKNIENPAMLGLDLSTSSGNFLIYIKSLINFAQLRCLEGREEEGRAYWEEAVRVVKYMFRGEVGGGEKGGGGGSVPLLTQAPVPLLEQVVRIYKRLCVCALGLGVAGRHLDVLDAFLVWEQIYKVKVKEGFGGKEMRGEGEGGEGTGGGGGGGTLELGDISGGGRGEKGWKKDNTLTLTKKHHRMSTPSPIASPSSSPFDSRYHTITNSPQWGGGGMFFEKGGGGGGGGVGGGAVSSVLDVWTKSYGARFSSVVGEGLPEESGEGKEGGGGKEGAGVGKVEQQSVRLWGMLHAVKVRLGEYAKGKVSADDTLQGSLHLLHKTCGGVGVGAGGGGGGGSGGGVGGTPRPYRVTSLSGGLVSPKKGKGEVGMSGEGDGGGGRGEIQSFGEVVERGGEELGMCLYLFGWEEGLVAFAPVSNKHLYLTLHEEKKRGGGGGAGGGVGGGGTGGGKKKVSALEDEKREVSGGLTRRRLTSKKLQKWYFLKFWIGDAYALVTVSNSCTVISLLSSLCFPEEIEKEKERKSKARKRGEIQRGATIGGGPGGVGGGWAVGGTESEEIAVLELSDSFSHACRSLLSPLISFLDPTSATPHSARNSISSPFASVTCAFAARSHSPSTSLSLSLSTSPPTTITVSPSNFGTALLMHFPSLGKLGTAANPLKVLVGCGGKDGGMGGGVGLTVQEQMARVSISTDLVTYTSNLILGSVPLTEETEEEKWVDAIKATCLMLTLFPSIARPSPSLSTPSLPSLSKRTSSPRPLSAAFSPSASSPSTSSPLSPSLDSHSPSVARSLASSLSSSPASSLISSLITPTLPHQEKEEKKEETQQEQETEQSAKEASLKEIFGNSPELSPEVSCPPLLLLVSFSLRVLPWEALFPLPLLRIPSLTTLARRGQGGESVSEVPKVVCGVVSGGQEKREVQDERARRRRLGKGWKRGVLSGGGGDEGRGVFEGMGSALPFPCPIIQKRTNIKVLRKKYRNFHFVELREIGGDIKKIGKPLEIKRRTSKFPIFLLTYADLADFSITVHYLMTCYPTCCLLFVPSDYVKSFAAKLAKVAETYNRRLQKDRHLSRPFYTSDRIRFITSLIRHFKQEHNVPVVAINAPLS